MLCEEFKIVYKRLEGLFRDGSLLWYEDLAKFVKERLLDMKVLYAYPSILKEQKR